jgi:hypothetical protein
VWKDVYGNVNGRGNKIVTKACVPVTDTPFIWTDEDGEEIERKNVPQCNDPNPSQDREEGWCRFNSDTEESCPGGYTNLRSSEGMGSYWGKQNYIDYCAPVPKI